jgi:DNA-binding transcriptional LysR family regulator
VESVARLGSLAKSSEELGVSPGAVSQQVAKAEKTVGFSLFERGPKGLTMVPRGEEICALLTDGFLRLAQAVELAESSNKDVLTVSVAPILAARWLIWRLPRFQSAYPNVKVRLDASLELIEPGISGVDLCIRVGRGDWRGVDAENLFPQIIFPVCAPALAERLSRPSDLRDVPIIREPTPTFNWEDWLSEGDPSASELPEGPVFSDASLCLDAAISCTGVFLTFETLATDPLAKGHLIEPFGRRRATRNAYWFVTPEGRRPTEPARLFRRWFKGEITTAGLGAERDGT